MVENLLKSYFSSSGKRTGEHALHSKEISNLVLNNEEKIIYCLNESIKNSKSIDDLLRVLALSLEIYDLAQKDLHELISSNENYSQTKELLIKKISGFDYKNSTKNIDTFDTIKYLQNFVSVLEYINLEKTVECWHSKISEFYTKNFDKEKVIEKFSNSLEEIIN